MNKTSQKEWFLDSVDPSDVVVVVLGGGRGTRLYPLTRDRAKPAVSFGGKYRLIDVTLTNCLRSGFEKIFILTQFNSFSLNRHIWQTYSREVQRNGFIDVIAAEQTNEKRDWFQGTADAVRQSLRYILFHSPRYVLILSADQIYCMDYRQLLLWHQTNQTDITIAAHYTLPEDIHSFGVVQIDRDMRVRNFYEKPRDSKEVANFSLASMADVRYPSGKPYLCSMGIYLFDTKILIDTLHDNEEDFGKAIIPKSARQYRMICFPFEGYWEDVGTIEAFYRANMEWRKGEGIANMFEQGGSIITHSRMLPPSRIDNCTIQDSIIADGCHIKGTIIKSSIIGVRSRIDTGTVIEDSIIMGNDVLSSTEYFEIGANCHIRKAIIDKNVVVGEGSKILNERGIKETENKLYTIRSGIVVIPRGTVIPPKTTI